MVKTNPWLNNNGFTLMELLIVALILSIFLAMARPILINYIADCQLTSAAILIQEDIRSLAQQALVEENGGLRIVLEEHRYRIYDNKMTSYQKEVIFPSGVVLIYNNFGNIILISPRGMPKEGGQLKLKSTGTEKVKYVIITPVTGRIRVSDYPSVS